MLPRGPVSRKAHGEHNLDVCDKLFAIPGCDDWVVTTAFYASLHLIEHELFPLTLNSKTYHAFADYYFSLPKKNRPSRHQVKIDLAHDHTSVGGIYEGLYNQCMTARYKDYRVLRPAAVRARTDMLDIRSAMKK